MDEVYRGNDDSKPDEGAVEELDSVSARQMEFDMQAVIEQAVGGTKNRIYQPTAASNDNVGTGPFIVKVKLFDQRRIGICLTVNRQISPKIYEFLDVNRVTVDDLKRRIVEDPYNASQLGLINSANTLRTFQLGKESDETGEFEEFDFSDSLQAAGIERDDVVYIRIEDGAEEAGSTAFNQDNMLRERINRINGRH